MLQERQVQPALLVLQERLVQPVPRVQPEALAQQARQVQKVLHLKHISVFTVAGTFIYMDLMYQILLLRLHNHIFIMVVQNIHQQEMLLIIVLDILIFDALLFLHILTMQEQHGLQEHLTKKEIL